MNIKEILTAPSVLTRLAKLEATLKSKPQPSEPQHARVKHLENTVQQLKRTNEKIKNRFSSSLGNTQSYELSRFDWAQEVKQDKCCDLCGSTDKLQAHHLFSKNNIPELTFIVANGVPLCADCHNTFHRQFEQEAETTPEMYYKYKYTKDN